MDIILGATGQVGGLLAEKLLENNRDVRIVVRDAAKAQSLKTKGAEVFVADYFDAERLKQACVGGETLFLLTPENPASPDILADTAKILANYREAIQESSIKKIVALSSFGAQHGKGTGNLEMSHMLEQAFSDMDIEQVFVRAAYYFSNWMAYYDSAKNDGILPTFFPADLKIPMISPDDVAAFLATVFMSKTEGHRIFEIAGPENYSVTDIAEIFGKLFSRRVTPVEIPEVEWIQTLKQVGFSPKSAENIALMTRAVIDGKTQAEGEISRLSTTFSQYSNFD